MQEINSEAFKRLIANAGIAFMGIPVKESINYMPYGAKIRDFLYTKAMQLLNNGGYQKVMLSDLVDPDSLKEIDYNQNYDIKNFCTYDIHINNKSSKFLIPEDFLKADLIVNVPKFKTHCLMTFTGAIKNIYGVLPGNLKKELHKRFPDNQEFAEMLINLYGLINPRLNIIDSVYGIQGDGPGKKGEKKKIGYLIGGENGFAVDYVASQIMGIDPFTIPILSATKKNHFDLCDFNAIEIVGERINECVIKEFKLPATYKYKKSIVEEIFKLSKEILSIDDKKCVGCGLCYDVCPAKAIKKRENCSYIDNSRCIGCMSCIEICPRTAVSVTKSLLYDQLKELKKRRE